MAGKEYPAHLIYGFDNALTKGYLKFQVAFLRLSRIFPSKQGYFPFYVKNFLHNLFLQIIDLRPVWVFFTVLPVKNIWQSFSSYATISSRGKKKILRIALC